MGLKGRGPLALSMITTVEDDERLHYANVSTDKLREVIFEDSVPLTSKPAISLPPLEALLLYGGRPVQEWLSTQGLQPWEYGEVAPEVRELYQRHFDPQLPLCMEHPPFARVGGWHVTWPDDDFYIPREMRLMLWTFEDAEPWHEVFLSPLKNYVIKSRITRDRSTPTREQFTDTNLKPSTKPSPNPGPRALVYPGMAHLNESRV